jgi:hypothetical protein
MPLGVYQACTATTLVAVVLALMATSATRLAAEAPAEPWHHT